MGLSSADRTSNKLDEQLSANEKKASASLMRVNHAGEVCAQGLYEGQAMVARSESVRSQLLDAASEEKAHLQWCAERLKELNSSPSVLVPLFYGSSVLVGSVTGLLGDRLSLGFVEATEDQVCAHLDRHLNEMPPKDERSREILERIRRDEQHHGRVAIEKGGIKFPEAVRRGMTLVSKLMTWPTRRI